MNACNDYGKWLIWVGLMTSAVSHAESQSNLTTSTQASVVREVIGIDPPATMGPKPAVTGPSLGAIQADEDCPQSCLYLKANEVLTLDAVYVEKRMDTLSGIWSTYQQNMSDPQAQSALTDFGKMYYGKSFACPVDAQNAPDFPSCYKQLMAMSAQRLVEIRQALKNNDENSKKTQDGGRFASIAHDSARGLATQAPAPQQKTPYTLTQKDYEAYTDELGKPGYERMLKQRPFKPSKDQFVKGTKANGEIDYDDAAYDQALKVFQKSQTAYESLMKNYLQANKNSPTSPVQAQWSDLGVARQLIIDESSKSLSSAPTSQPVVSRNISSQIKVTENVNRTDNQNTTYSIRLSDEELNSRIEDYLNKIQ